MLLVLVNQDQVPGQVNNEAQEEASLPPLGPALSEVGVHERTQPSSCIYRVSPFVLRKTESLVVALDCDFFVHWFATHGTNHPLMNKQKYFQAEMVFWKLTFLGVSMC